MLIVSFNPTSRHLEKLMAQWHLFPHYFSRHFLKWLKFRFVAWFVWMTDKQLMSASFTGVHWLFWVVSSCSPVHLLPSERVKVVHGADCYEGHGMQILLPSDVQGRRNALIISSRVPLKEKPSDGGWSAPGWGVLGVSGRGSQYSIRIGPWWYRISVLNSIELN